MVIGRAGCLKGNTIQYCKDPILQVRFTVKTYPCFRQLHCFGYEGKTGEVHIIRLFLEFNSLKPISMKRSHQELSVDMIVRRVKVSTKMTKLRSSRFSLPKTGKRLPNTGFSLFKLYLVLGYVEFKYVSSSSSKALLLYFAIF